MKFFDVFHIFFNLHTKVKYFNAILARAFKFSKKFPDTEILHPFYKYLEH